MEILKKHKVAIAWLKEDFKGINPSISMHKILMEENVKPSIEHQKKAQPNNEGGSKEGSPQMAQCRLHLCHFR